MNEQRPVTRGDCDNVARPCRWTECRYNLTPNVDTASGRRKALRIVGTSSCALDVADEGGRTLEQVGEAMGLVRERVRQIEVQALAKLLRRGVGADAIETGGGR